MSEPEETLRVQAQHDGVGTLFERRYWVDILGSQFTPHELMSYIMGNFNEFSPDILAKFEKTEEGDEGGLEVDDEFHIRILGPWNGNVRVTEVNDHSFEFVTLEGHPEAGTIRFQAEVLGELERGLHFEIRSLARARDGLVAFAHEKLGVGMWIQEKMWLAFCRRVAEHTCGQMIDEPQSQTLERGDVSWWSA